MQGKFVGNLLQKFLKIFFLREFAEEFATQFADETCRGISLGKFAENFAGGNFTFFPSALCYCGKGSNSNPQKTLTGLLFAKVAVVELWESLFVVMNTFFFFLESLFERCEIIYCPYSNPYLKISFSYLKPYLNDEKLFGVLIQRLI